MRRSVWLTPPDSFDPDRGGLPAGRKEVDVGSHRHPLAGEAGPPDVAGDADADVAPLRAKASLLIPHLGVADQLEGGVQRARVVTAVIQLPGGGAERKLLGTDEVAAADLDGVDPELVRQQIDGALDEVAGLGPVVAAVRLHRRLVREGHLEVKGDLGDLVTAGDHLARQQAAERRNGPEVGANVGQDADVQSGDDPIGRCRDLHLADEPPAVAGRDHRLASLLDPFHRTTVFPGEDSGEHVLRVDVQLGAEGPADITGDDADLVFGDVQDAGQHAAHDVRGLGGQMQPQRASNRR